MFNRVWKHIIEQPFISATAFAALIHSTWSLGTLFAGEAPGLQWSLLTADTGAFALQLWSVAYWLLPALAIAFALDVGQVATAHDISSGQRNARKYATFVIFSLATYYLQFVYIAHHMPALSLGEGVAYPQVVNAVRNAGLWIIPALLPLSTMLYTFSHDDSKAPLKTHSVTITAQSDSTPQMTAPKQTALPEPPISDEDTQPTTPPRKSGASGTATGALSDAITVTDAGTHEAHCPECDYIARKPTAKRAQMSLTAHMRKHASA